MYVAPFRRIMLFFLVKISALCYNHLIKQKLEVLIMSAEKLSIVIAVIAIVSPIITTIINNRHSLKVQSMQFSANNRLSLYQDFLDLLNSTLISGAFTTEVSLKLKQSFSKVYLVCSNSTRALLDELENYISFNADQSIGTTIEYRQFTKKLIRSLRSDLKKLR